MGSACKYKCFENFPTISSEFQNFSEIFKKFIVPNILFKISSLIFLLKLVLNVAHFFSKLLYSIFLGVKNKIA